MIFARLSIASLFLAATLAAAPNVSAQTECRRSCDRTFQACNRNAANAASCTATWHACKNYCRSAPPGAQPTGARRAQTPRPAPR